MATAPAFPSLSFSSAYTIEPLTFPAPTSTVEKAKQLAAHTAVAQQFPPQAKVVGIGSGSTVVYAVEKILQMEGLREAVFVPTGFQSRELIVRAGLRLGEISEYVRGEENVMVGIRNWMWILMGQMKLMSIYSVLKVEEHVYFKKNSSPSPRRNSS
jgi:hypothetical protein